LPNNYKENTERIQIQDQKQSSVALKIQNQIIPVMMGFLTFFSIGISNRGPIIPSKIPICDPRPKDSNIEKNNKLQKGAPGSFVNTSAITIKAKPVPWAA